MLESQGIGGRVWAGMAMAAGVLFLFENFGIWHLRWSLIWPLALMGAGVSMLLHSLERKGLTERAPSGAIIGTSVADTLREWVTFGGVKRRLDTQNFQGGEMNAVFGGIEVDLRRANIATPGGEVVIDANATLAASSFACPIPGK